VKRIYCYHIRKTGGTSLHFSFLGLGGEDPAAVQQRLEASSLHRTISGNYAFVAHQRPLLDQGDYFYGWSHLPARRVSLRPGTFTITIFRDPIDRVVSYYSYLCHGDQQGMAFAVGQSERALSDKGFSVFIKELPKEQLLAQLFMFSRSLSVPEAAEQIARCSCVMFTDEYESGLVSLARRLALPLTPKRERTTRARLELSSDERERLRHLLQPEYDLMRQVRDQPRAIH
jgi:hypothetical protein